MCIQYIHVYTCVLGIHTAVAAHNESLQCPLQRPHSCSSSSSSSSRRSSTYYSRGDTVGVCVGVRVILGVLDAVSVGVLVPLAV